MCQKRTTKWSFVNKFNLSIVVFNAIKKAAVHIGRITCPVRPSVRSSAVGPFVPYSRAKSRENNTSGVHA